MKYEFTEDDLQEIEKIKAKYPEVKAATLPALWVAQNRFGHVNSDVQKLVAETLELPEAHVHGVATFYTQYYKEEKGKFVLDVCTCLSCQLCGGYDVLERAEEKLGIKAGETTDDGMFTLNEVECLGACGYAPMLQITNDKYVNNLTPEKIESLIEDLKAGKTPEYEQIEMPLRKVK
ncbi:NADH-quinone oxidoreductase subunit NuoE family protein [Rhodohalobacter halophilus]|uniref:NADH-quinone oxidoreductase subunit NuoE family protein n=1 Tax=Rhodohalobacter halophilus TaxID=1812810 RepID=UPI00083F830C|nr:NAD(P)H-dependent oxidoreductase subunit E [Rhodohalobacter halophilus]